jgi:DNA (cytosine-5)-methyltransferase 1
MRTFASLFTGGGLADIGAMQAGYEVLWGVEFDAAIAAVANANLPHRDQIYAESVVGFDWSKVERPDHLHMSPPCQDFSVAKTSGKVGNDNDALADACVEAIRTLQPSTVTLENVEGYRKAAGFNRIVDTLWGLGYWVNSEVLNAADMGVPQTRRRLILRAVHGGFPGPLPPPVKPWRGWYEAIEDLIPTLPETEFAPWQLARLPEELKSVAINPNRNGLDWVSSNDAIDAGKPYPSLMSQNCIAKHKAYLVNSASPGSTDTTALGRMKAAVLVDDKNNESLGVGRFSPSPAVRVDNGTGNVKASTPSGRVVRMTSRALARFQTVPDWYTLPEKNAIACKIIGNGIPCLMMQRIMECFHPEG